jgi:hypothetical protein
VKREIAFQLIPILGQCDGLFSPQRGRLGTHREAAIQEQRDRFSILGMPIPKVIGNEAEQKRRERGLDAIEQIGLAIFHRSLGRRTHWRLDDSTDWQLRRMVTWSDYPEMLTLLFAVRACTNAGYHNNGFVLDLGLAGVKVSESDGGVSKEEEILNLHVEEIARPALCRGFLESAADLDGVTGYKITEAGRSFLDDPPPPPDLSTIEYDNELNAAYLSAFDAACEAVANIAPIHGLHFRLGCGSWPSDEERGNLPPVFLKNGRVRSPENMLAAIRKIKT